MRNILRCALLGCLFLAGGKTYAQFGEPETIGKEAEDLFEVRDQETKEVKFSLKRYRGRVMAFYFWRTSEAESVRLLSTVNQMDKKLRPKGVRFCSMTPDTKETVEKAIADKGIELLSGDSYNFYGPFFWFVQNLFGAMSHPEVAIVDPHGMIAWRGSPNDRLEERLLEICESTQPLAGDPKRMAQRLRQADKFLDQGEVGKAYSLAKLIYRVTDDDANEHGTARSQMDKLEQAAAEWLKKAVEAERGGDIDKAAHIVSQIAVRFDDEDQRKEKRDGNTGGDGGRAQGGGQANKPEGEKLQIVKDAEQEIGRMMADRKLKQAIKTGMDQCKGELLLEKAADMEETNQFDLALASYREIIKKYKESAAAKTADENIRRIKDDKKLRVVVDKSRGEAEARRWMDIAERYAKLDLPEQAREYYERVIAEHPKLEQAKEARKRLDKLPKSAKETVDAGGAKDASGKGTP